VARRKAKRKADPVTKGAVPPEQLERVFPTIDLPVRPPFPPQDAASVAAIPQGSGWFYEEKYDGFRCLAFREGNEVLLQSKAGQPLGRYFPEIVRAVRQLTADRFVLDGEIVIFVDGHLSFDDLLLRIHPAESRIRKLSAEIPATLLSFDLLVENGASLLDLPFSKRRMRLEQFARKSGGQDMIRLSIGTTDHRKAQRWMQDVAAIGLDGIVAKRRDEPYRSGERTAMVKVKRMRTADCVVGGFRYAEKGGGIGSLLLGLFNDDGLLDHVGFTSSFNAKQRLELKSIVESHIGSPGFTGKAPGGPSRWSTKRSSEWQSLKNKLVCEVQYDHFSGGRFRHGTKFLRWRPEKKPSQCTFEQVRPAKIASAAEKDANPSALAS
jgi:ATP-dependent DNA ligase